LGKITSTAGWRPIAVIVAETAVVALLVLAGLAFTGRV
jgi:hypothetical protein